MAKIFITGSSDGIGLKAAQILTSQGHHVYLHARNDARADQTRAAVPDAADILIGDLSTIAGTRQLAERANSAGPFDAVVHNAGLGPQNSDTKTEDKLSSTFAVNSLAPYILTSLMEKPKRLLYLSSSMHDSASDDFEDITWTKRKFNSTQAYCDSKLHDVILANAVARRWTDVQSCSLDPGWVKTKMGSNSAPGTTDAPANAIADFVVGKAGGIAGTNTGVYFNPFGVKSPHGAASSEQKQDEFLGICENLSGVKLPA